VEIWLHIWWVRIWEGGREGGREGGGGTTVLIFSAYLFITYCFRSDLSPGGAAEGF